MLCEILGAGKQGLCHGGISGGIMLSTHSASKHSTGHHVTGASYQKFWSGADEPAHAEGPARRVGVGKRAQHCSRVEWSVHRCEDVSGKHDLVELTSIDAGDGLIDCLPPFVGCLGARSPLHIDGWIGNTDRTQLTARVAVGPDHGDPGLSSPTANQHARHDDE